ncbi:MAG: peptidyl-prolyl cis-trans isomerase, partial [Deltaproteobacteria bacterium]|nr:peptidyl-prolyl cis-trans isomerase [Deltaproteobacteria bacterium]
KKYELPALLTMTHVFVDPDKREDQTLADAEAIGAELRALEPPTAGAEDLGDPFMLQSYYPERSEAELAKLFGAEFARSVFELEPDRWHGPVLSGYGVHWVFVEQPIAAETPEFAAVRDRVEQDWRDERREKFNDEFYAQLRARYEVVVEGELTSATEGEASREEATASKGEAAGEDATASEVEAANQNATASEGEAADEGATLRKDVRSSEGASWGDEIAAISESAR